MQTFLPLDDFRASLRALDSRRLGKQRVECKQLLNALTGFYNPEKRGWVNHPCTLMWKGYEVALVMYMNTAIEVWVERGYNNTMEKLHPMKLNPSLMAEYENIRIVDMPPQELLPRWFGDEAFHRSHQSNLLRKAPEWYGQFGWDVPHDLPYIWPV